MTSTRTARLFAAASVAALLAIPGAASAQQCSTDEDGSPIGTPEECSTETEVEGIFNERPDSGAPDPEAAPELAATGVGSGDLALAAFVALGAGGAMTMASRRRREEA